MRPVDPVDEWTKAQFPHKPFKMVEYDHAPAVKKKSPWAKPKPIISEIPNQMTIFDIMEED